MYLGNPESLVNWHGIQVLLSLLTINYYNVIPDISLVFLITVTN